MARSIAILTPWPEWPLARQTPQSSLRWGDAVFTINPRGGAFDLVAAYDGVPYEVTLEAPTAGTLLITGEPPSIKYYDERFVAQFHRLLTCHTDLAHPRKLFAAQGHPWYAGVTLDRRSLKTIDELRSDAPPEKTGLLSVIASHKSVTPGHRHRKAFVTRLAEHFGERIAIFGRGVRDIDDKAEAILPYRYHIVLENSEFYDYWTEKIADAYLCRALPLYWGCPNIDRYFPEDSFLRINIYDPDETIRVIEAAVARDAYGAAQSAIETARRRALEEYNMFAILAELAAAVPTAPRTRIELRPEAAYRHSLRKRLSKRLRRALPRVLRR